MFTQKEIEDLSTKTGLSSNILQELAKPLSYVQSSANIDEPSDVEIMKQIYFSGQDVYDYNKNKLIDNVSPTKSLESNIGKDSGIPHDYSEKYEIKDKSPLDYLNENIGDSFLIPPKIKKFQTGVNISVDIHDKNRVVEHYNRKQKFGLGYKPMTFVSEVKYDDVSNVYYHEHRETTQLNREYPNVKFMLKRYLSEDLHTEAQNIAKKNMHKYYGKRSIFILYIHFQ